MGSNSNDSMPAREVHIRKDFYLSKHEVTQAQWKALQGKGNPSAFKGERKPITNISWEEVQRFIEVLNREERTTAYRLPTEAEWEYAARAGTQSEYLFGNDTKNIVFHAWYNFNSAGCTQPVGMKKTNAFGLHDMQGNVSEWVQDMYEENPVPLNTTAAPTDTTRYRVVRGCSWRHDVTICRSAQRLYFDANERHSFIGFRLLREIE